MTDNMCTVYDPQGSWVTTTGTANLSTLNCGLGNSCTTTTAPPEAWVGQTYDYQPETHHMEDFLAAIGFVTVVIIIIVAGTWVITESIDFVKRMNRVHDKVMSQSEPVKRGRKRRS